MRIHDQRIRERLLGPMGLSEVEDDVFYGIYHGFQINICLGRRNPRYPFFVLISSSFTQPVAEKAIALLKEGKDPRVVYIFDYYSCSVYSKGSTFEEFVGILEPALERAFHALEAVGCKGYQYCPICDELLGDDSKLVKLSPFRLRVAPRGIDMYQQKLGDLKKSYQEYPYNPILGFIGALLAAGVTFGVQLGLLYLISFAAFVPIFGVVLGEFLYSRFAKKPVLSCLPLVATLVFVGSMSAIAFYYANWAFANFPDLSRIDAIRESMSSAVYVYSFVIEAGVSIVDLALGTFFCYRRLRSKLTFPPDMVEI